jgi:hypothetical protein
MARTAMPGLTPAETAACQPVAITSDSANRLAMIFGWLL